MSTARSLVRLAFAGLFVNVMAVACVVSDGDDDDDTTACDPGAKKDCVCSNGEAGEKKCAASGNGYGACDCSGATNGGNGGGGGEGNASTTAGTNSNPYGGANTGGAGGDDTGPVNGGAGGDDGLAGAGGAGGAGTDLDAICLEDPGDDCQECVQVSCCEEWKACNDDMDGDCVQQFFNIMACADPNIAGKDITPADLKQCAEDEVAGGGAWSDGLLPTTKALIDCTGGGQGWENMAWDTDKSCSLLCFQQK